MTGDRWAALPDSPAGAPNRSAFPLANLEAANRGEANREAAQRCGAARSLHRGQPAAGCRPRRAGERQAAIGAVDRVCRP